MKRVDHILLGGNIASLVCARELLKTGCSVALVAPPGSYGGHFSPHEVLGFEYDMGMVLCEFDSYKSQLTRLSAYDPMVVGSVGQFAAQVSDYLAQYFEFREIKQLNVALRHKVVDDYFISNSFAGLREVFTEQEVKKIKQELSECIASPALHASKKALTKVYDSMDFKTASQANHGALLHQALVEPLVLRATNLDSSLLNARFHRLFWAPLFYPETLLEYFETGQKLTRTRFHHPVGCSVGRLSRLLIDELTATQGFTAIPALDSLSQGAGNWTVNERLETSNLSSSLPQNVLAGLLDVSNDELQRSSYLLVFLKVEGSIDCEVLFNASDRTSFFRIVNQSRVSGESEKVTHLIVEYNLDHATAVHDDFRPVEDAVRELQQFVEEYSLGRFKVLDASMLPLKNKIVYPGLANVGIAEKNSRRLDGLDICLMGPSLGMNGGALNDQIVQALQYVESRT